MTNKELHTVHDAINDIWKLIKTYHDVPQTKEALTQMIKAGDEIYLRHDRNELCRRLIRETEMYLGLEEYYKGEANEQTGEAEVGPAEGDGGPQP